MLKVFFINPKAISPDGRLSIIVTELIFCGVTDIVSPSMIEAIAI
jgi:hypothetical protein